jgi:hypothetical protein
MASKEIEELVLDTLYFRRRTAGTCLQANVAGQELQRRSAEVLPYIERVIRDLVVPALSQVRKVQLAGSSDLCFEETPFRGLSDLLGAYLLIGSRHDAATVVRFLRKLPATIQARVIGLLPVFFRKVNSSPREREVNDVKPPLDEQLLSFIKESSQSGDSDLRKKAERVIAFFLNAKEDKGSGAVP